MHVDRSSLLKHKGVRTHHGRNLSPPKKKETTESQNSYKESKQILQDTHEKASKPPNPVICFSTIWLTNRSLDIDQKLLNPTSWEIHRVHP